jgi:hypothetical protein
VSSTARGDGDGGGKREEKGLITSLAACTRAPPLALRPLLSFLQFLVIVHRRSLRVPGPW